MPVKILVADDSATMRSIVEMTFAGEDASVVAVGSGEAALEQARRDPPDVLLADASMSGMDGYATAQAFKADPSLGRVPVVLLTSQFNPFDGPRASAAGVDAHLDKPFTTQVAIDQVMGLASRGAGAQPAASPPAASPAARPASLTPPVSPAAAPPRPSAPAAPRAPSQQRVASGAKQPLHKRTIAFGVQAAGVPGVGGAGMQPGAPKGPAQGARPQTPSKRAPQPPSVPAPRAAPTPEAPSAAGPPTSSSAASQGTAAAAGAAGIAGLESKLAGLGLTDDQMRGVLALSKEVVEQVVWEVVPELAEHMIREELQRLTQD